MSLRRVESVAWAAERKDVLCGLLWMLTLAAHLRYARRPGPGRFLPAAGCLALALMAKPMAVTLPLVLLILDWWPLNRFSAAGRIPLLLAEKAPLLLLSALDGLVTLRAQIAENAVASLEALPLAARVANACHAVAAYLAKTVARRARRVLSGRAGPASRRVPVAAVRVAAVLAIGACAALTARQTGYWRDAQTLYGHAIAVTKDNRRATYNLGLAREERGDLEGAMRLYRETLRLGTEPKARLSLALLLDARGETAAAVAQLRAAALEVPEDPFIRWTLAQLLEHAGEQEAAIAELRELVRLRPDRPEYAARLAALLARGRAAAP